MNCGGPQHVEAARPVLILIAIGIMIFGAMIAGMGSFWSTTVQPE
jgi:hypothetical protein